MLEVAARQALGAFRLDVAFTSAGRLTALWGPSGSGKTSIVNLIGGLTRPADGRIEIDGRTLTDTEKRIFVPKHRRRIGTVFQDARLFPHLTVAQNLCYGRFFAPARERYAEFGAVVDLLGIGALLGRRPGGLSGGEKQRVAIGRALLASPRLILMDEPLASLDDARKAEIMPFLERLRDETKIPIVYVSHSLAEVVRLATDIVVLETGRVTAAGPAREVIDRLNLLPEAERGEGGALLRLTVEGHDERFGLTLLRSAAGLWRVPRIKARPGDLLRARVRARDVMIATEEPKGVSAVNVLPGRVVEIADGGAADAVVRLDCGGDFLPARVTRYSAEMLRLVPGMPVFAIVKAVAFEPEQFGRGAASR